jgi:hypothetical protein
LTSHDNYIVIGYCGGCGTLRVRALRLAGEFLDPNLHQVTPTSVDMSVQKLMETSKLQETGASVDM